MKACITAAILVFGVYGAQVPGTPSVRAIHRAVPLSENTLPYEGYGAVTILSDGTLLIEVGGEEIVHYAVDEEGEGEEIVTFTPFDVLAYQIDTTGLALVQRGTDVFLDKNGAELRSRGLSPRQVFRTSFPDAGQVDPASSPYSIASFSGRMKLVFDAVTANGLLSVQVTDSDATGSVFSLTAPVATEGAGRSDGSIVLNAPDAVSDCSITCPRGGASIHCDDSGCKCYCKVGKPVCECTNSARSD